MLLFFDTETTGKVDFNAPYDASHQPKLAQLAYIAYREDGYPLATFAGLVKLDGWEMPQEAANVHGLTTGFLALWGITEHHVTRQFLEFVAKADTIMGHNVRFDVMVMAACALRHYGRKAAEEVLAKPTFCTMEASTNICKLPGRFGKFKWPRLSEVYSHAFNEKLEGAHDALVDIRATKRIADWLKEKHNIAPAVKDAAAPAECGAAYKDIYERGAK